MRKVPGKYGLTVDQYRALHIAQSWQCAICGTGEQGKTLAVDHDHATGAVRELLCFACNCAIGFFKDSPRLLRQAAEYLEKHGCAGR